jgi:hypothetical protein
MATLRKKPSKRARLRDGLRAVHAQNIQNRSDLEDVMGATQDTIEDVMKVVLAATTQTMRLAEEELDRLYDKRNTWLECQDELEDTKAWLLKTNLLTAWHRLPWWKKAIHFRMRPSTWQQ